MIILRDRLDYVCLYKKKPFPVKDGCPRFLKIKGRVINSLCPLARRGYSRGASLTGYKNALFTPIG